jgi:hypothetical protein
VDVPTLPPCIGGHAVRFGGDERVPGVVVVFSGGAPSARVMTLASAPLELGRGDPSAALGLHRTQLRRLVERHDIAVDTVANDDEAMPPTSV